MAARKKKAPAAWNESILEAGKKAVETIEKMMQNEEAKDADRIRAAQILMDRACLQAQAETPQENGVSVRFEMDGAAKEYGQ